MIKKAICALLLTGSFSGMTSATSVDDMGFDVSSFKQTGQQISVKEPKAPTLVQESKLASYVSEVGVDVANLSQVQLDDLIGSYDQLPSAIFCDEHQEFEIQISSTNIWQRTKLMKLRQAIGDDLPNAH